MHRFAAAAVLVAVATFTAPVAAADPDILIPNCSSGQVPTAGECRPGPNDAITNDAPGANPDVPLGLNPESEPAV